MEIPGERRRDLIETVQRQAQLRFRLVGAPGGDASMDIPGVIQGVDLRETRPGEYEGTYTVRQRDNPDAFRTAVATLRRGDDRVSARLEFNLPPQITELLPAHGDRVTARGRTHIAARITDDGGGIDPSRVRLRVNGRDVTASRTVAPADVEAATGLWPTAAPDTEAPASRPVTFAPPPSTGSCAASPSGSNPRPRGSFSISSDIPAPITIAITASVKYAPRQPTCAINADASGGITSVPTPIPATASPDAKPRRRTNQRCTAPTAGTYAQPTPTPTPRPYAT